MREHALENMLTNVQAASEDAFSRFFRDLNGTRPPVDMHRHVVESVERAVLALLLTRYLGNQKRVAQVMEVSRTTIHKRMKALGLYPWPPHETVRQPDFTNR